MIKVLSLNVNSLLRRWKYSMLFKFIKHVGANFVFLQETHISSLNVNAWRLFKEEFLVIEGVHLRPSQGVALLAHCSLQPYVNGLLFADQRCLMVNISLNGSSYLVINFYASFNAKSNSVYYDKIYSLIKQHPFAFVIVSGDFNHISFPQSVMGRKLTVELGLINLAQVADLVREPTHFTAKAATTLDFIFISSNLAGCCAFELVLTKLSDHAALVGTLWPLQQRRAYRLQRVFNIHPALRLSVAVKNELYIMTKDLLIKEFIELNWWLILKKQIGKLLLKENWAFLKEQRKVVVQFEEMVASKTGPAGYSLDEWRQARLKFVESQDNYVKLMRYKLLGRLRLERNTFKALLCTNFFHSLRASHPILAIQHAQRLYMHQQLGELINEDLRKKFINRSEQDEAALLFLFEEASYSDGNGDLQCEWLSVVNIRLQLRLLNKHAAASQDGISVVLYLEYDYLFVPILRKLFMEWVKKDNFGKFAISSYFTCFMKDTGDKIVKPINNVPFTTLDNLRPINNEDADAKLFARLLNEELYAKLAHTIHNNQFALRGKSIHSAVMLLKDAHIAARTVRGPGPIVLFVDMCQAYDKVKHSYILQVLFDLLGSNSLFWGVMNYITSKYAGHKYKYEFYDQFRIAVGITQGSPVSGLLFALYLNPCLMHLQNNLPGVFLPSIVGNLKLIAYADDLVVLCNDREEVDLALELIESFHNCSGLTINKRKTSACFLKDFGHCNLGDDVRTKKYLGLPHPFFGRDARLKVQKSLESKIVATLKQLQKAYLSIKVRIAVINMLCIPKLNYVAPFYDFPKGFIAKLDVLFNNFIWKGHLPLIARRFLYLSPKEGGLGLINVSLFLRMLKVNALARWIVYLSALDIVLPVMPTDTPPPWFLQSVFSRLDIVRRDFVDDIPSQRLQQKFRYAQVRDELYASIRNSDFHVVGYQILKFVDSVYVTPGLYDFTYKILHMKLPSNNLLISKYRMDGCSNCALCDGAEETQDHILCVCNMLVEVRCWAQRMIQRDLVVFKRSHDALLDILKARNVLRFILIVWHAMWKLRCNKIFQGMQLRPLLFVKMHVKKHYQLDLKTLSQEVVEALWPMVDLSSSQWDFLK